MHSEMTIETLIKALQELPNYKLVQCHVECINGMYIHYERPTAKEGGEDD